MELNKFELTLPPYQPSSPHLVAMTETRKFQNMQHPTHVKVQVNPHNRSEIRRRSSHFIHRTQCLITTYRRAYLRGRVGVCIFESANNCTSSFSNTSPKLSSGIMDGAISPYNRFEKERRSSRKIPIHSENWHQNIQPASFWYKNAKVTHCCHHRAGSCNF